MVQQLETVQAEAGEPTPSATLASREYAVPAEARPTDATPVDAVPAEAETAVPASPASLWASESRVLYSITHTEPRDARAWIDCECVIRND